MTSPISTETEYAPLPRSTLPKLIVERNKKESLLLPKTAKLLIVDEDQPLRERLGRAMEKKKYEIHLAATLDEARKVSEPILLNYAIVELKLSDGSGLHLLDFLKEHNPAIRIVVLTDYGSIATAVWAIKQGVLDYLPKPADVDVLHGTLRNTMAMTLPPLSQEPMSTNRVKWEHIQRVLISCNQNVSETARQLKMHRRTLQRILAKHAPRF